MAGPAFPWCLMTRSELLVAHHESLTSWVLLERCCFPRVQKSSWSALAGSHVLPTAPESQLCELLEVEKKIKQNNPQGQPKFLESNFHIMSEQDSRLEQYYSLAYVFYTIGYRLRLRKSACWWQCWGNLCRDDDDDDLFIYLFIYVSNLEHFQIIFLLQVLKIGSCL